MNKLNFMLVCLIAVPGIIVASQNVQLTSDPSVKSSYEINTLSETQATVDLNVTNLLIEDALLDGNSYQNVIINGFDQLKELGKPSVPVVNMSLVIPEGTEPVITVISKSDTLLKNIIIPPFLDKGLIEPSYLRNAKVSRDEQTYSSDGLFPISIAKVQSTAEYRDNQIAFFQIFPLQCNPVTKEIVVSKHLSIEIKMVPASGANLLAKKLQSSEPPMRIWYGNKGLSKRASAPAVINDNDSTIDILIITTPALKEPADTLRLWHAMKGYESKVVTAATWTTTSIKDTITKYYATKPAPSYFIILGDQGQIPGKNYTMDGETAVIDFDYALMGGASDDVPDLARGRIPANNTTEAYAAIKKIIKYEKTPPTTASFYQNVLAASCFQAENGSTTLESKIYSFSKTIEDARVYLLTKSYTVTRLYSAESNVTPQKWWTNDGNSGTQVDVPADLKKPTFAWNAADNAVNTAFNKGAFLIYQYDHGMENGWADPSWNTGTMKIENGDMLPAIYSINCLTGSFQMTGQCFAEKLLLAPTGGAVNLFAASAVTYATPNITTIKGLMEVTWPGYIKDGRTETPVYTLGDIMDKSFIRVEKLDRFHRSEYLVFGDPTTKLLTVEPAKITATHNGTIAPSATSFSVSQISVSSGIATLVDAKTAVIIGKAQVSGGSVSIPVKNIPQSGELVLTVSSNNSTPYQGKIAISTVGVAVSSMSKAPVYLTINKNIRIAMMPSENVTVSVFNTLGKLIHTQHFEKITGNAALTMDGNADGLYYVNIRSNNYNQTWRAEHIGN